MQDINLMFSRVVNTRDFIASLDLEPGNYQITINTNIVTGERFIFSLELTKESWYRLHPCILKFPSEQRTYIALGETMEAGTLPLSKLIGSCITMIKELDIQSK